MDSNYDALRTVILTQGSEGRFSEPTTGKYVVKGQRCYKIVHP